MALIRYFIACVMLLATANVYAGRDPLGWSQSGEIPATTELNQSYAVNFTVVNNLPFRMPTPLEVSNNSTPGSEVTMATDCDGVRLTPGQTCSVGLILIPKTAGTKQLSVYIEYGKNKVQIPKKAIVSTTAGATASQLQGTTLLGFPTAILSNTTYSLSFQFTNTGSTPLTGLTLSPNANNSAGYTQSSTTCSATLAAGASCNVQGSFSTAAQSGIVNVGYTYTTGTIAARLVTTSVISSSAHAVRTFTFINNCSHTVWFGFVGGAVNSNPCKTNSQCAHGSTCDPTANQGAGSCFYNNPVPANGVYQLATSATNTVPVVDYNLQYVWSGNIAARTGPTCANGVCDTADCASGGGNNACPVGRGFDQPATLSEFTLQRATVDSYDISILNGMNVGAEITPTTTSTFNPNGISPAAYNCQSPGKVAPVPSLGLGGCDWAAGFIPPAFPSSDSASSYVYVKPPTSSPTVCTDDSVCTTPPYSKCGLHFNKTNNTLSKVCGELLGYNTANQVCSFANTNQNVPNSGNNPGDAYFPCDTAISGGTGQLASYTNWAMYACKAQANGDLGTCYNTAANPPASTPNCCGCVDWQNVPGVTVPSATTTCVNFNSSWTNLITPFTGYVLPGVEWLKKACPTAYVYPFDDKSSGFACMDISSSHTVNTVNYTITFCPT